MPGLVRRSGSSLVSASVKIRPIIRKLKALEFQSIWPWTTQQRTQGKEGSCDQLHNRVAGRNGRFAVTAFATKDDPTEDGNVVIAGNRGPARWACRPWSSPPRVHAACDRYKRSESCPSISPKEKEDSRHHGWILKKIRINLQSQSRLDQGFWRDYTQKAVTRARYGRTLLTNTYAMSMIRVMWPCKAGALGTLGGKSPVQLICLRLARRISGS